MWFNKVICSLPYLAENDLIFLYDFDFVNSMYSIIWATIPNFFWQGDDCDPHDPLGKAQLVLESMI
jgi:hypothetical protein